MDLYHVWFDLNPGVGDLAFCGRLDAYLGHLKDRDLIASWRLTRRKLGLAPAHLAEFHLIVEVRDLAQLDAAFGLVAGRREPTEGFHFGVNAQVRNASFALYRDFPDAVRHHGEERF